MSTFGFGPFENDDALDFLDEIEDASPDDRPILLRAALDQVLGDEGFIAAPQMSEAIAAAVVIGAALHPDEMVEECSLPDWVLAVPPPVDDAMVQAARRAVTRALTPENNGLWQLWGDIGEVPSVLRARLEPILNRLRAIPA